MQRLLPFLLALLLAMPLIAEDDKPPLPDPNDSEGWSHASSLAELKALPDSTLHLRLYDADDNMLSELKRLEGLQSLSLSGSYGNAGIRKLESLKQLRDLQLDCANLGNVALSSIGLLRELEWLGLEQCSDISNSGLEALAGLNKLSWLIIHGEKFGDGMPTSNSGITDAGLRSLAGMKAMKRLDISGCSKLQGRGFADCLPKMKLLEALDLMSCEKLGDDALGALNKHPTLKTLTLSELPELGDKGVAILDSLKSLETLSIQSCGITQACLADLAKCKKLETLIFKGKSVIGAEGLAALAVSKSLKTLEIEVWSYSMQMPPGMGAEEETDDGPRFDDDCLKLIGKFRALEQLHLTSMDDITNAGLQHLKGLKLISVGLVRCNGIDDDGLAALAKIKGLRRLRLGCVSFGPPTGTQGTPGPHITDAGLKTIAGMESLTEIDLAGQKQITDAGLKLLAGIPTLVILRLSMADFSMPGAPPSAASPITDEGIAALAALIHLKQLDISGTAVTDAGLAQLHVLTALESLSIHTCPKLTPAGVAAIKAALPGCAFATDEGRPQD